MIVGASVVLKERDQLLFEIQKPSKWIHTNDGCLQIGMGCIGGGVERGESAFQALEREVEEEICCKITLQKTNSSYELKPDGSIHKLQSQNVPRGVFLIWYFDQQEYKKGAKVVVFLGRVSGTPTPGDLPGILKINQSTFLRLDKETLSIQDLVNYGSTLISNQRIPPDAKIKPVGTANIILNLYRNAPVIFNELSI